MAVNPPPQIPNTVPDPFRKYVAIGLAVLGGASIMLGVITAVFPQLGGQSAPAFQWGVQLLAGSGLTAWDRQQAALAR